MVVAVVAVLVVLVVAVLVFILIVVAIAVAIAVVAVFVFVFVGVLVLVLVGGVLLGELGVGGAKLLVSGHVTAGQGEAEREYESGGERDQFGERGHSGESSCWPVLSGVHL